MTACDGPGYLRLGNSQLSVIPLPINTLPLACLSSTSQVTQFKFSPNLKHYESPQACSIVRFVRPCFSPGPHWRSTYYCLPDAGATGLRERLPHCSSQNKCVFSFVVHRILFQRLTLINPLLYTFTANTPPSGLVILISIIPCQAPSGVYFLTG